MNDWRKCHYRSAAAGGTPQNNSQQHPVSKKNQALHEFAEPLLMLQQDLVLHVAWPTYSLGMFSVLLFFFFHLEILAFSCAVQF